MNLNQQIQLALQGDARQAYFLGLRYYLGEDVIQDYRSSIDLFTRAAEQGFVSAQFQLGLMYYEGYGVQKNLSRASHWFHKAARRGHTWSQYYCALMNRQPMLPG